MASIKMGSARRSSLVATYGVGSLIPTENDSLMVCGLDDWPEGPEIVEPRLAESLGVFTFRAPNAGRAAGDVPVVRFPEWAFCPECRRLGPAWKIADRESRRCLKDNEPVSPSRFVACCSAGHIEDFPYLEWVHGGRTDGNDGHDLRLTTRGKSSALSDLVLECSCGSARSMAGAFQIGELREVKACGGRRPWLPALPPEGSCPESLRALQRGSSNVWFAQTRSSISIPSVAARARAFAERQFRNARPGVPARELASHYDPPEGCTAEDVERAIEEMRVPASSRPRTSQIQLRAEEYRALRNGLTSGAGSDQFLCTTLDLAGSGTHRSVRQLSRVSRLREVRALVGFSRVAPVVEAADVGSPLVADGRPGWLPAIEVLGEGIFLDLDQTLLDRWAQTDAVQDRVRALLRSQDALSTGSLGTSLPINGRSLLLHSLAHVLIDELSLAAGYPAASLRERLYDETEQAGILIYTASADSAGSLGGLAALSEPKRFAHVLASAVHRAGWCSSDPVCIESGPSGVDGLSLAACHACMLLPETSCERLNVTLDRALLVGTPREPEVGFFNTRP